MTKYRPLNRALEVYHNALRRADAAVRRGLKEDAAYWMKIADHAYRITRRSDDDATLQDRLKRVIDAHRSARQ